jgi:7-keto-8-aminopelargonate synthetase-like enzyme
MFCCLCVYARVKTVQRSAATSYCACVRTPTTSASASSTWVRKEGRESYWMRLSTAIIALSLHGTMLYDPLIHSHTGCDVLGDKDSPVIPLMIFNAPKLSAFSRACLERGIATVVVGFPATPLLLGRARFCISAGHTRAELDFALKKIDEVVGLICLRYCHSATGC